MQRGVPILLVTLSPCSEADAHPLRDRSLDFQGPAHMDAHPPSWACLDAERPVSMSFPLSSPRFSSSAFSSVFHSINPSAFKKQKKVSSALTEVRPVGLPAGAKASNRKKHRNVKCVGCEENQTDDLLIRTK